MTWCWWCCHPFEGEELHLPYKYDSRRNRFETCGFFCSWGCMKSYNIDKYKTGGIGGIIAENITLMRKRKSKDGKLSPVKPAPHRHAIDVFGGTLSIEEFRKCTEENDIPLVLLPNELHAVQDVVKVKKQVLKDPTVQDLKDKMDAINISDTSNGEALKLKRAKPLKRNQNNLLDTLGITFKTK